MKKNRFHRRLALICTAALICLNNGLAATVVAPAGYKNIPGEGGELLPVLNGTGRFQNVYEPSEFLDTLPNGGFISEIDLRMDEFVSGTRNGLVQDLEVRMSVSPSVDPIMSLQFSANLGDRIVTVYSRKALQYSAIDNGSLVKDFNIKILLDQPFFYNPIDGGLSVDYFFHKGATTALLLDSAGGFGLQGGLSEPTASLYRGLLVAQFTVTPIPEPSVAVLFVAGVMALGVGRFRGRQ